MISCTKVTLLKLPSGFTRGSAHGFCAGKAVGTVEAARRPSAGCWWPDGPQLLTYTGQPAAVGNASGQVIPGSYRPAPEAKPRALVWTYQQGNLQALELQPPFLESSWATAAGGNAIVGTGSHRPHAQSRLLNAGWVWREQQCLPVLCADQDVWLYAGDGQQVAGSLQGQAALWTDPERPPIALNPPQCTGSEVVALDGEFQFGKIWKGFTARPALWQGGPQSFQDLTPEGFATGVIAAAAGGIQVGSVRVKENTANDTPGSDNRACIWQGSPKSWMDLQDFLPPKKYNASRALGVYCGESEILVCGEASFYEVQRPDTRYEGHLISKAHPVLWHLSS